MTEKRFTINKTWGKSLNGLIGVICDNNNDMYITDVVALLNNLSEENEKLKSENKRLTNKLNETALEFVNHYLVSMGKAVEISEMSYSDFLKFRKERGKPMELQE